MFLLVLEMMLGAVITPTFCEYVAFSTTFALIKPVSTFLLGGAATSAAVAFSPVANGRGGGSAEPLPQALAQHAILLFIAAGVNFRIHCDRRRIWLLSLSASRRSSGRRRHRNANAADPTERGGGRGQTQSSVAAAFASIAVEEEEEDPGWASGWCTCDSGGVATECADNGTAGPAPAGGAAVADPADWDALRRDGYFTAEDRAELAPVVQEERQEIRRRAHDAFHRDSGGGGSGAELRWHHAKEIVGAGSFGYVYQAINDRSGELMAVKFVPLSVVAENSTPRCDLGRQLRALELFSHPNIVRYRGVCVRGESLCVLMEFCDGGSISCLLQRYGAFDEIIVRRYAVQILSGLFYLHRHSIVHRDLKNTNCLVCAGGVVKVADFGAARRIKEGEGGSVEGAYMYLAPEVLRRGRHGRRSDVWSYGCCVLEMLALTSPLGTRAEAQLDVADVFRLSQMRTSPELPLQLSEEARDFLAHCLHIDP
eukprot:CAMPEP_0172173036 /NCGR_PEP_ID=MMETSP1050-20130122/12803_1 /TAXON_ID=233186 /ORGANISM="Cryptomonas curvata, Strain CCAP979/52" /LENGTH=482 /DNA_ID=CAMNT_0012844691 /DNA_START=618 /DNA_END=2062 /DNA_ORIENTATION=-